MFRHTPGLAIFFLFISQNLLANMSINSKDFEAPEQKLRYTLFIDEPITAYDDISEMSAFNPKLKSNIPLERIRASMLAGFFPFINSLQINILSGSFYDESLRENLVSSLNDYMNSVLENINDDLPETPSYLFMAYLPWEYKEVIYPQNSNTISFTGERSGGEFLGRPANFNRKIVNNIFTVLRNNFHYAENPYSLLGIIINLKLQKNKSEFKMELLTKLTGNEYPIETANDQVAFSYFIVPEPIIPELATVMIASIERKFRDHSDPIAHVQFGPFGGFNKKETSFKITDDNWAPFFLCGSRHSSAPYLKGTLKKNAVPGTIGKITEGKAADFRIYDLSLNLIENKIETMHLYLSIGFKIGSGRLMIGCFNKPDIDEQFKDEANNQISNQLIEFQSKINFSELFNMLISEK